MFAGGYAVKISRFQLFSRRSLRHYGEVGSLEMTSCWDFLRIHHDLHLWQATVPAGYGFPASSLQNTVHCL
jgi:hypothetical protein